MNTKHWSEQLRVANEQGARLLLASCCDFLTQAGIEPRRIRGLLQDKPVRKRAGSSTGTYHWLVNTYEAIGALMSTWHSEPRFLDINGYPCPLSPRSGSKSLQKLIDVSGVRVDVEVAHDLMSMSPSIRVDEVGKLHAKRRVFVLPEFEIMRAALFIDRYLGTLRDNTVRRRGDASLLLERSCYASGIDIKAITPVLRDARSRATALVDSVDGELEMRRPKKTKGKSNGEVGLLVFTWAKTRTATRDVRK